MIVDVPQHKVTDVAAMNSPGRFLEGRRARV